MDRVCAFVVYHYGVKESTVPATELKTPKGDAFKTSIPSANRRDSFLEKMENALRVRCKLSVSPSAAYSTSFAHRAKLQLEEPA